ncbi:MAG TPA: TetR/AcrR family transcriptional regulator [Candidatus Limnocylindria bacterium]|nr:TetR/AcrR family transcriptional regulator [Candidatus Limnocylindria bacterium]
MLPSSAVPKPIRRREKGTRTRAEIVAAAEILFATRGYEATRVEDIATQVGIRRAAIFYHFGDKQELYTAVLDEIFGDWTAALPTGGSAVERLEASLLGWIDYIARRPTVARLILREAASAQPGMVSQFVRSGSATVEWFRSVIDEGTASGELRPLIEPHRFMSLTGAMTVFHFAAIPWLAQGAATPSWGQDEIEQHKREVLLVVRTMLGIERCRGGSG